MHASAAPWKGTHCPRFYKAKAPTVEGRKYGVNGWNGCAGARVDKGYAEVGACGHGRRPSPRSLDEGTSAAACSSSTDPACGYMAADDSRRIPSTMEFNVL